MTGGGRHVEDQPAVSKARWGGVSLVVMALLAAIVLAMLSPTEPGERDGSAGTAVESGSPEPSASLPTGEVPDLAPTIATPSRATTRDLDVTLTVSIPETTIRPQKLELAIARNGEPVETRRRPGPGDVEIGPLELQEGENEFTAWLDGPGGAGPTSEPVVITVDRTKPMLKVGRPRENQRVPTATVEVAGRSEPDADVEVETPSISSVPRPVTVRPDGTFDLTVKLAVGDNRIKVVAMDPVGNRESIVRHVIRKEGRRAVEVQVKPPKLLISRLPRPLRIVAVVTDEASERVAGAAVTFILSLPGQGARTYDAVTDSDGRATWDMQVDRGQGIEAGTGQLGIDVTFPDGRKLTPVSAEITVR